VHTDPRVIASWEGDGSGLQPPLCGGRRDFSALVARLNEPVQALGFSQEELQKVKPVYHLTIAAAKDGQTGVLVDRYLDDAQWADVAREYLHRLGLARRDDDAGVRWVAVRHADDHVHVVATLVRQDGRRVWPRNDRYRSREASQAVEARYGLRSTAAGDRTGNIGTSRGERRKHAATARRRHAAGLPGPMAPDREVLRRQVRTAAAGAAGLEDFLARLQADGLLVRQRMSTIHPGEVTGYAVALPDRYDTARQPVFFGARPDSSRRAAPTAGADRFGLTPDERRRVWEQASAAAARATAQITASAATDPGRAADAAWAASDFLAAAGRVVEGRRGGPLSAAAEQYDRAAREMFSTVPAPTPAGHGLRAAGRLLLATRVAKPSETRQLLMLLAHLTALADAVTRLREIQQRAAQASAARAAAEQLREVHARYQRRVAPVATRFAAAATVSTEPVTATQVRQRPATAR
jgi:hypothetical protein